MTTWHLPSDAEKQATKVLDHLKGMEKRLMSVLDDIKAGQARIVKAVENLAADVRELIGKIPADGGLTASEAQEIKDAGESIATAAEAAAAAYQSAGESTPPTK